MKNSEVSAYIACAIEAALLVVNTDPHRGTRRRAATTLLHAIQVRQRERGHSLSLISFVSLPRRVSEQRHVTQ